jgi:hypothetical protein
MNETLGLVLIVLISFTTLSISDYLTSLDNREAIKAGLEQCKIGDQTIWVKDCKETLKLYKENNE